MILNALEGRALPVYGKGHQIRDWLYVEDHACALVLAATKGVVGETYNIGGHNEKQNIEVVRSLCAILDDLVPPLVAGVRNEDGQSVTTYCSLMKSVADRPGHDRRDIDQRNVVFGAENESFDCLDIVLQGGGKLAI